MRYTAASGIPQLAAANTLKFTPSVNKLVLADTNPGNVDWACGSATTATATAEGIQVTAGTILGKYVPTQCK